GQAGLPRARVLPRGRPRGGHGVPGAPPAREHVQRVVPARAGAWRSARGAARGTVKPFANEPTLELRRAPARESLQSALRDLDPQLPLAVPVLIGRDRGAHEGFESTDPGEPDRVVATAGRATEADAARAVEEAAKAFPEWRSRGAAAR